MGRRVFLFLCLGYFTTLVLAAVFAPWLTEFSYDQQQPDLAFASPSSRHWLGTDNLGRDNATRLLYGARISLYVGFSVVITTVVIGMAVGMVAAFRGGWVDTLLMRFTDGLFAFPDILLAILIIGIAGPSALTVIVALTVVGWPAMARLVRAQVLGLKESLYVRASLASGAPTKYVVLRHILPHLAGIVLAAATVELASVILAESALSFLGIGIRPPMPSWGALINTGREFLRSDWLLVVFPCVALSLTVISLNLIGDFLKEHWDPRRTSV